MKVLVINGSPRDEQSNSMILTRAFLEGAGWNDADILSVPKLNIRGCTGCFGCWGETPGECVIKDDMKDILPKLIEADVVIWSFPLYYFSVPGDLKNLIDRQLPLVLPEMSADAESGGHPDRYDFSHQRHIIISTCGFWTDKGNYDGVTFMYDKVCGKDKYTKIYVGQGPLYPVAYATEMPNDLKGMLTPKEYGEFKALIDNFLLIVKRAGKEFANGKIEANTQEELARPILPKKAYEQGANASW